MNWQRTMDALFMHWLWQLCSTFGLNGYFLITDFDRRSIERHRKVFKCAKMY